MIEGTQPATSRPPFSDPADPEKRGGQGPRADEGGLSAGAGSGEKCCGWADLMSEQVGALGPSVREIFRGPTLIKVKSLKSDFDRRDPAGNFSAAFLHNR